MPKKSDKRNKKNTRSDHPDNTPGRDQSCREKSIRKDATGRNLSYREMSIRKDAAGRPVTLDTDARSVEVIGATEDPVEVMDYERYEPVNEILLMAGLEMPKNRQVPLLDSHRRWDGTSSVMGSYRDMRTDNGQLTGTAVFSSAPEAEGPWTKVREGHVTDFSVGYRVIESTYIPAGQKQAVKGRTYEGPLRVTTRWRLKELSVTPIGADERAKARNETHNIQKKEYPDMNAKLRAILEARGLAKDADDPAAWKFFDDLYSRGEINLDGSERTAGPEKAAAAPASETARGERTPGEKTPGEKTPDQIRADAARAERERIGEITAMAEKFDYPEDRRNELISDSNVTVDRAREKIMAHIENTQKDTKVPARQFTEFVDEKDKFRAAAEDAILIRSGISGVDRQKAAPGATELSGYSLVELARHALVLAGQSPHGDIRGVVGRALTTSDFPYLLANVANKSLFIGWASEDETWQEWCDTGSVNDFKTNYSPRASEFSDLDEVPEDAEYKYGSRTEAQEQYKIATYGKLGAVSRQTIINDNLNAITKNMMGMGEAASRKVGDVAYAVLTANAAMGDGIALFHASHLNYVASGSGAAPGKTTIAAGILAMGTQKDLAGKRRLNISPRFFIAPRALEGSAEEFFRSGNFSDSNTVATDSSLASTRVNPYAGTYFTRVYESRLDDDVATAWYLAARKGKTVTVYFLNGVQAPYFETKAGWTVDGTEFKVRIDAGAKAMDWKGLYYNYGA